MKRAIWSNTSSRSVIPTSFSFSATTLVVIFGLLCFYHEYIHQSMPIVPPSCRAVYVVYTALMVCQGVKFLGVTRLRF